jgi:hypothetical protein
MSQQHTKLLMSIAAFLLGAVGLTLSFLPDDIAAYFAFPGTITILLQLMGALYLGFAFLNWMTRQNVMGGIYQKPVVLANFTHFTVAGLALAKYLSNHRELNYIWLIMAGYFVFALFFGYLFFNNPKPYKRR